MRTDAGVTGELQVEAPPRVEEVSPSKTRKKTDLGLVLLVSAAILIPCFWQRHIQGGDLASHVYNPWRAQWVCAGRGTCPRPWVSGEDGVSGRQRRAARHRITS